MLQPLLGVSELLILMSKSRVAELYMWRAHMGYSWLLHRSMAETLARSRSNVWIIKGKQLAQKVCRDCMECRKERRESLEKQMATLRPESSTVFHLGPTLPWTMLVQSC